MYLLYSVFNVVSSVFSEFPNLIFFRPELQKKPVSLGFAKRNRFIRIFWGFGGFYVPVLSETYFCQGANSPNFPSRASLDPYTYSSSPTTLSIFRFLILFMPSLPQKIFRGDLPYIYSAVAGSRVVLLM